MEDNITMKKSKRRIAAILCTALLASLCGCGKEQDGGSDFTESQRGRYVETQEELPEQLNGWTVKQLFTVGDRIHLLATKQEGGKTILREWEKQEDGFVDVTQEWLASIELQCGTWLETELSQEESGTQYLFAGYVIEGEEDYKGHLWRGEGTEAREITPKKWTELNEDWGSYEYVQGAVALDNGTVVAQSYTSIDIFSGEDGSILESQQLDRYYGNIFLSDGENVYLGLTDDSGRTSGVEIRKDGKGSNAVNISFPEGNTGTMLCALKGGTLISAGADGFYRYTPDSAEWEKLVDGLETDFSLQGCWCIGLAALPDGRIYALMQESGGGIKLNKYEYDPDAVIEVKETLKLYTVHESYLLNQAAALYHRAHPEVVISIQYVYPRYYYDTVDYNAVYQELNTMLMGDAAPDILVMDHLNIDSYAEKGLLADINDVVEELEKSGALLSGITGAYIQENGRRYVVPLQFGFNLAVGRDISTENMGSIKALAEFLGQQEYNYLGNQTVSELVDKFYPYFCDSIIRDKQLDKEVLGEYLEYLKTIADNCGIIGARDENERGFNLWDLPDQAKLAFEEADGFKGCMFPMAINEYIKGDFTAFENRFIPSVQTGVSAKSQYVDTAKDFLKFALSEEVQDMDYYSGFPVNLASLQKQSREDRSEAEAETAITVDGGYEVFQIKQYPEETSDKLLAICKNLNRPIKEDSKIREVLIEALGGYFDGSQSKEDTIQKIEGGLKMYLAE